MNHGFHDSGAFFDGQLGTGAHGADWAGLHGHAGQFGAPGSTSTATATATA
jgi:hypothetical protein